MISTGSMPTWSEERDQKAAEEFLASVEYSVGDNIDYVKTNHYLTKSLRVWRDTALRVCEMTAGKECLDTEEILEMFTVAGLLDMKILIMYETSDNLQKMSRLADELIDLIDDTKKLREEMIKA